ncbi:glycoside hydrolase family 16 protein [Zasmidium cellare ATCC 36951]|uniref:Glycoside hydrolase family 16 protein n=1 Tax=Zasmidium cellare ATCC 36951 TaxID=1080233 RepID=A0A6A6CUT2_ZASCE|nr:glycoside hydrolase family 16 protein [Zasmidium cellare ATCC 36951]KAF2170805.1 glycoside hydrolase family 16 protein [Zasmidium cellare ATCC 36951]
MKASTTPLALALCVCSVLGDAPSTSGTEWKKTQLLDDFTGTPGSLPSSSNWIIQTGTSYPGGPAQWGTGEVETYTSSTNIRLFDSGHLWIVPQRSSSGAWTSGRIESRRNDFAAPAGGKLRVEARIKMPDVTGSNGLGYWPAFWLVGGAFRGNYSNWPAVGEIDIMENINGQDTITEVLHCDVNPGGACNEPSGLGHQGTCTGSRCPGNFHIYEVVLDRTTSPEQLKFWLDRKLQYTITETQLGSTKWANTLHRGFYVVLNVAMGGAYPNAIAGFTTPTANTVPGVQMSIDYVAVWTTS